MTTQALSLYEQKKAIKIYLDQATRKLELVRPPEGVISVERLKQIAMVQIDKNPKIADCTKMSIFTSLRDAAKLGIIPDSTTNEGHLVPFKSKGEMKCQFMIGYKGLIKLAMRTGYLAGVEVRSVQANDDFSYSYGLDPHCEHRPASVDRGEFIGAYAIIIMKDGRRTFEYVSLEEGMAHAKKFSKAVEFGPWKTDPSAMVMKTALRKALKYVPLSGELDAAIKVDERGDRGLSEHEEIKEPSEVTVDDPPEQVDKETGEITVTNGNHKAFCTESQCADLMAYADSKGMGPTTYMKLLKGNGISAANEIPAGDQNKIMGFINDALQVEAKK